MLEQFRDNSFLWPYEYFQEAFLKQLKISTAKKIDQKLKNDKLHLLSNLRAQILFSQLFPKISASKEKSHDTLQNSGLITEK